jgi:hypothetical protein
MRSIEILLASTGRFCAAVKSIYDPKACVKLVLVRLSSAGSSNALFVAAVLPWA